MSKEVRNFNRRYAKEYNIFRSIFYMSFLYIVVFGFFNIFYNYKVVGRENIPKSKDGNDKYIYAANHVSIFDPPMVVMAALRPVAFMAKKELFEPTEKLSWLVKRLGAFAVDRVKPEIATFKTVKDIISTNWTLGIFPQGGIRPYGKLEDIRKGFVAIARAAKADIILLGKAIDAVYSADPLIDKTATRFDEISYLDVLNKNLKVMDSTSTALCRDNNIPLIVFGIADPENIVKAVKGEDIGTRVR